MTSSLTKKIKRKFSKKSIESYDQVRAKKYKKVSRSYDSDHKTVVIYQMGKVGSSTVKHSLDKLGLPMNLYHVHALTKERIDWLENQFQYASSIKEKPVIHDHVIESIFLRELIDQNKHLNWKIITLIRDPIARNISTFFQSLDIFFPEWEKDHNNKQNRLEDYVEEMIELFLQESNHELPLIWFDSFLKPVFDIDVYAKKFPAEQGYDYYSRKNVELVLIRLEDINDCAETAINEFLSIDSFTLEKANISSEKDYSEAYSKFKKLIKLPNEYINEMYSSRFTQHFYTQGEIDKMKARWEL